MSQASNQIQQKLKLLPKEPGIYFHKNSKGKIIYIGKAALLSNRVRQYFHKSRVLDPKTDALVAEIADIEWVTTDSEIDALFLEAEMIRRYQPPYNILLRDDKSLSFVRIDYKSDYPTVTMVRRPLDDGAEYLGPYINSLAVKRALRHLRRVFPYAVSTAQAAYSSRLYEQIGLDPGIATGRTSLITYRKSLRKLMQYLRGDKRPIIIDLERSMAQASKNRKYEEAARIRNQLSNLHALKNQIIFSDREFMDLSKDYALVELTELLGLGLPPRRIEGFDISHMSGTDNVASMVVFDSGMPAKAQYRKFKMRISGNDDFAHMHEVIKRRFSDKNVKQWGCPNLLLIDGGRGQLASTRKVLVDLGLEIPAIGLAKQHEQIIVDNQDISINLQEDMVTRLKGTIRKSDTFSTISLPPGTHIIKLLQRIRDESHRFAISYHSTLKQNRQTRSWLDSVPGIGPKSKKKLIREFGSVRGILQARSTEVEKLVGSSRAQILMQYIRAQKSGTKVACSTGNNS